MMNLFKIWKRPVHISTKNKEGQAIIFSYSEKGFSEKLE
jgi:hypothetical protein